MKILQPLMLLLLCLPLLCAEKAIPVTNEVLAQYSKDLEHYRILVLVDNYLFLGGRNVIIRLSALNVSNEDPSLFVRRNIRAGINAVNDCLTFKNRDRHDCSNHIRLILKRPLFNDLIVCGTNAYKPTLYNLNLDLTDKTAATFELGFCSPNPDHMVAAVWVENGNPLNTSLPYIATTLDASNTEATVYRPKSEFAGVQFMSIPTPQIDWLSAPNFIASFDVGDQVLFFITEKSVEASALDDTQPFIYSRVIRVCKNDRGAKSNFINIWTTFRKARIVCNNNNETIGTTFNEMKYVTRISPSRFDAVYSIQIGKEHVSIICSYDLNDIISALEGTFKNFDRGFWEKSSPDKIPKKISKSCSTDISETYTDEELNFLRRHVIMHDTIKPISKSGETVLFRTNALITSMATSYFTRDRRNVILYISTDKGEILKICNYHLTHEYIILQKWFHPAAGYIRELVIGPPNIDNHFIYAATDKSVIQIDARNCEIYEDCDRCLLDPHCEWRADHASCTAAKNVLGITERKMSQIKRLCSNFSPKPVRIIHIDLANKQFPLHLPCVTKSQYSSNVIRWKKDNAEVSESTSFMTQDNGLLLTSVDESATYTCFIDKQPISSYVFTKKPETKRPLNITGKRKCIDAETYLEQYYRWCHELENYQKAYADWERIKKQSCPRL